SPRRRSRSAWVAPLLDRVAYAGAVSLSVTSAASPGSTAYTDGNTPLDAHARRRAQQDFIAIPDQVPPVSYGAFKARTRRSANILAAEGIAFGDRISVLSENTIEALVIFWGALRAGVIVNPINAEIREKHVGHILDEVRPKLVFWHRELPGDPLTLVPAGPVSIRFGPWNAPNPAPDDLFARLRAASDAPVTVRPKRGDWSCINYTSGTTDVPKGAIWTHEAYYAMSESPVDRLEITHADTILDY